MLKSPLLTSSRERHGTDASATEEIERPSAFDLPDSFLISLFSFSFLKRTNLKRYQVIGQGIGTFIALVFYQHAIYDILWVSTFSSFHFILFNFCLLFGSILCLVLSRSLESLIQYEAMDPLQNDLMDLINKTNYLCGYIDSDFNRALARAVSGLLKNIFSRPDLDDIGMEERERERERERETETIMKE
jgi:hypothetical protein